MAMEEDKKVRGFKMGKVRQFQDDHCSLGFVNVLIAIAIGI